MDPHALVQEPFRYLSPRNRPAGGNRQPFQRRERLRAYGPVGVAVLVYPIGHIVSGLTNLTEDIAHGGPVDGLPRHLLGARIGGAVPGRFAPRPSRYEGPDGVFADELAAAPVDDRHAGDAPGRGGSLGPML